MALACAAKRGYAFAETTRGISKSEVCGQSAAASHEKSCKNEDLSPGAHGIPFLFSELPVSPNLLVCRSIHVGVAFAPPLLCLARSFRRFLSGFAFPLLLFQPALSIILFGLFSGFAGVLLFLLAPFLVSLFVIPAFDY